MGRLSSISSNPVLAEYAQGAAQRNVQPVADFIAPGVEVPTLTGRYKIYTEANRFKLPRVERGLGGSAVQLSWDATDGTYNCTPKALDLPVDYLEEIEGDALENALQEGADMVAEIAGLSHEKTVIDLAVASAGNTAKTWSSGTPDPVDDIDTQILDVVKNAKYGSLMGVGVVFGATAWKLAKNTAAVKSRYIVAAGAAGKSVGQQAPSITDFGKLLIAEPEVQLSLMVVDTAKEGVAESLAFVLDSTVLIFARRPNPTRRDPSFMKTFRLRNQWMKPGSYTLPDGRGECAKFDWTADVKVVNSAAGKKLTIS